LKAWKELDQMLLRSEQTHRKPVLPRDLNFTRASSQCFFAIKCRAKLPESKCKRQNSSLIAVQIKLSFADKKIRAQFTGGQNHTGKCY
tara:strand:- start:35 stop:298 length:264 start_codon:yes stop_codon:yes gene_type:complete